MTIPNRNSGRRGRIVRNSSLRVPLSRGRFLRTAGLAAAGVGAAAVGVSGATGQMPVYVDTNTPLNEIQKAVDGGGLIIFKSGDYYQFSTTFPFSIVVGRYGKDVNIVGEDGARIMGGLAPFVNTAYNDTLPFPTAVNHDVSFIVKNLTFENPWFSAFFIERTSGTVVDSCTISVAMNPADNLNWGAGIWFRIRTASTGTIQLTNNHVYCANTAMAIGYGHTTSETPPNFLVENNLIEAEGCQIAPILCHGNVSNSRWTNNTIEGNGANMFYLWELGNLEANNVFVNRNNSVDFVAMPTAPFWFGVQQLYIGSHVKNSQFKNNDYGNVNLGTAGVLVKGTGNSLVNENFSGFYPGWESGVGCILFDSKSSGNSLMALKNGMVLQGFTICSQVMDNSGDNIIPGYSKCAHQPDVIALVQQKIAEKDAAKAQVQLPTGQLVSEL